MDYQIITLSESQSVVVTPQMWETDVITEDCAQMFALRPDTEYLEPKIDRRRNPEPLTFPTDYGGITILDFLEYTMINELSIKSLKWLRDAQGNELAGQLVDRIDAHEAQKVANIASHRKFMQERDGIKVKVNVSEKIKAALATNKALQFSYVPNEHFDNIAREEELREAKTSALDIPVVDEITEGAESWG